MSYKKTEQYDEQTTAFLMDRYKDILGKLGEDPTRGRAWIKRRNAWPRPCSFLCRAMKLDANAILDSAKFHEPMSEMIIVKDIEVYSLCEHHMLPFFGKAHVAYIPNGWITGLSKIARVVDVYARRPSGTGKTDHTDFTRYQGHTATAGVQL
ncbi:MAG: GTP cyclohydrolase I [Puia sp.]